MKCPVCKTSVLATEPLDENLLTLRCPDCEGHWVKSFQYWKWRDAQPSSFQDVVTQDDPGPLGRDSKPGKLCPECGRFLMHRPVGHDVPFNLDRCSHCGGMWFDQCEWDILQTHSLHRDAHFIFTEAWQAEVKETMRTEMERARLKNLLGDADYNRLIDFMRWMRSHKERAVLLATLSNTKSNLIDEKES